MSQAQRDLQTLSNPPTAYDVTLAQNAVDQAQRNLDQAQINSTQQTLTDTQSYQSNLDSAYNSVSNAFVNAPAFITDIQSTQRNNSNGSSVDNISLYRTVLGQDSPFVTNFVDNFDSTITAYHSIFDEYKLTPRTADQSTLLKLISDTLVMEKSIGDELGNARNIFDAIFSRIDYNNLAVASTVNVLKPLVADDITNLNKDLNSLQAAKDSLTTLGQNLPINTQKSEFSITAAQETLKEKQEFLAKLLAGALPADIASAQDKVNQAAAALKKVKDGADPLDIQNQQLIVQQRKNSPTDAQTSLDDYSMKSPFDGEIAKVTSVLGDTALSGQNSASSTAIATIITKQLLAQVSLNEVDAAKVKIGDKTTLTFDAVPDVTVAGQMVQLDTIGTSTQGVVSYNAKIAFDAQDARIKPGMSVTAAIVTQVDQDVLLVPNAAVKTQGTTSYVSVFDTSLVTPSTTDSTTGTVVTLQQPQRVLVQPGSANDTSTEITSGLQESEFVVTQTFANSSTATATATTSSRTSGSSAIRLPGLGGGGPPG